MSNPKAFIPDKFCFMKPSISGAKDHSRKKMASDREENLPGSHHTWL